MKENYKQVCANIPLFLCSKEILERIFDICVLVLAGDVLVYVNNKCVLGYTHHDMVTVFQSIAPGDTVELEVCRGYPLQYDTNDPNSEVLTTVAVGSNG